MTFVVADRVFETTTTTGTGTLSLAGVQPGYQGFVAGIGDGNTTYYAISDGVDYEIGLGTVTDASTDTLSRDTIFSSSNGDAKVNWGTGSKDVFTGAPLDKLLFAADNLLNVASAVTAFTNIKQAATDEATGVVELATNAETVAGTDTVRAITPAGLAAKTATTSAKGIIELATNGETVAGTDTVRAVTPDGLTDKMSSPGPIGDSAASAIKGTTLDLTDKSTLTFSGGNNTDLLTLNNENESHVAAMIFLPADRLASPLFTFLFCSSDDNGTPDIEFRLFGDGNGKCDGAWTGGGAGFVDFYEWADHNPNDEDRRGIAVTLVGEKIREAQSGERVMGVISGNPSFVGNAAAFRWAGKYLRDDFATYLWEDYSVVKWTEKIEKTPAQAAVVVTIDDKEVELLAAVAPVYVDKIRSVGEDKLPAGVTIPADAERLTQQRRVLNPAFDPDLPYEDREARREWAWVEKVGRVRILKGQQTDERWAWMRDISDTIEEWDIR